MYPVIDVKNCIYFERGKCKLRLFLPDWGYRLRTGRRAPEIEVGNVILATGYDPFDAKRIPQYGYGRLANVFTSVEFERMVNASGPTAGRIVLRDGVTEPEAWLYPLRWLAG